ncbi:amino acid ABC transporter permease [Lacrimispora sp.]|uniref:amino acid ABC transporter permease n=1 Tax=Lacrimispora sp. TaxID=2719234 RepID=UPI0032E3DEC0|nr:amino acid ABC transporter permease [Paenibacillaceae bacterium]
MDFEFIRTYAPLYASAAGLTLTIAFFGILLSVVIGLLCSLVKIFKIPVLTSIVNGYIEISRNTPLLIQLFFLYFGLPKIGIVLSSETCAITGLAFLGGSYMAEAFRTGIEQIPKIQTDSGLSLGMTGIQIFRFILLPQAIATSVPVFCANIIFLIKETSVFSAVALADLMFVAKDLIGIYYKTDEALFMLVISYLLILLPVSAFCTLLERRVRYAEFGNSGTVSGK